MAKKPEKPEKSEKPEKTEPPEKPATSAVRRARPAKRGCQTIWFAAWSQYGPYSMKALMLVTIGFAVAAQLESVQA